MKKVILTFLIAFAGSFVLFYFTSNEKEIGYFIYISVVNGVVIIFLERLTTRVVTDLVKRMYKPK